MAPPRVATWGGAFFRAAKIGCPSQVRPSAWGCAGRLRRSTCGLSLHMRPYCKQGACKTGTKTSQRAPLAGCSTQEIDLKERLSSAESAGPLASRKAAKRSRRLLTRRRGRKSSSPTTLVTRSKLLPPSRPRRGAASTSQGHPRTIFRRALERDNLVLAEVTAREIGRVTIAEALELTALVARKQPHRYGRFAARWLCLWLKEHDKVKSRATLTR